MLHESVYSYGRGTLYTAYLPILDEGGRVQQNRSGNTSESEIQQQKAVFPINFRH